MTQIYLFDWGDTLMVDFPDARGKMCDWPSVQAVAGAVEALTFLSKNHPIYVATNAVDSSATDIERAFERVGLAIYITGYFCRANLGIAKGGAEFYQRIVAQLGVAADAVTMVGDTFDKDIQPALDAGLSAIWLYSGNDGQPNKGYRQIQSLNQLCP